MSTDHATTDTSCVDCGRDDSTVTEQRTYRGFRVRLCPTCKATALERGHIRSDHETDEIRRAVRSAAIGQTVTFAGRGIVMDRTFRSDIRRPVDLEPRR